MPITAQRKAKQKVTRRKFEIDKAIKIKELANKKAMKVIERKEFLQQVEGVKYIEPKEALLSECLIKNRVLLINWNTEERTKVDRITNARISEHAIAIKT